MREVCDGGASISSHIGCRVVSPFRHRSPVGAGDTDLTPAEEAILRSLAKGNRSKKIAQDLAISVDTVNTHIRHIYEKLHVHSRPDAHVP